MLRLLKSFDAQPRLSVVTRTLYTATVAAWLVELSSHTYTKKPLPCRTLKGTLQGTKGIYLEAGDQSLSVLSLGEVALGRAWAFGTELNGGCLGSLRVSEISIFNLYGKRCKRNSIPLQSAGLRDVMLCMHGIRNCSSFRPTETKMVRLTIGVCPCCSKPHIDIMVMNSSASMTRTDAELQEPETSLSFSTELAWLS